MYCGTATMMFNDIQNVYHGYAINTNLTMTNVVFYSGIVIDDDYGWVFIY